MKHQIIVMSDRRYFVDFAKKIAIEHLFHNNAVIETIMSMAEMPPEIKALVKHHNRES